MNPLIKIAKEALEEAVDTGATKGAKAASAPAPHVVSGPGFDATQGLPANFNPNLTQRLPPQKPAAPTPPTLG